MIRASDIIDSGADHVEIELASDQRPFHGMLVRAQNVRQDGLYAEYIQNVDLSNGVITSRGGSFIASRSIAFTIGSVSIGGTSVAVTKSHGFYQLAFVPLRIIRSDGSLYEDIEGRYLNNVIEFQSALTTGPYPVGSIVQSRPIGAIYRGMAVGYDGPLAVIHAEAGIANTCRRIVARMLTNGFSYCNELYVETTATQASSTSTIYVARVHGFLDNDIVQIGTEDVFRRIVDVRSNRIIVSSSVSVSIGTRIRVVSRPAELRDVVSMVPYGNMICFVTAPENRTPDTLSRGYARPACIANVSGEPTVMPLGIQRWKYSTGVAVSASAHGSSSLAAGEYGIRLTYYSSHTGFESEPSPEIRVNVAAGQGIYVTVDTAGFSAEQHVDEIRVYRSYVNTVGLHYRVRSVRMGSEDVSIIPHGESAISFWILDSDISLGAQLRVGANLPPSQKMACLCHWEAAGRLCGALSNSSYVFYSDVPDIATGFYRPNAWPATNYFKVGDDAPIMGFVSMRDGLLVIKSTSIWFVSGTPPNIVISQVYSRDDSSAVGAISRTTIASDEDVAFVLSTTGLYIIKRAAGFDGLSAVRLDENIAGALRFTTTKLDADSLSRVYLLFDRSKKQIWLIYSRYAKVGTIVSNNGQEALEWSDYSYLDIPNGAPMYVGSHPTSAIVAPNVAISDAFTYGKNLPSVHIGYDESIMLMNYGELDAELYEFAVLYQSAWLFIPGIQRARLRAVKTTVGLIKPTGAVSVRCASDEKPMELLCDFVQNRKSEIVPDTKGVIDVNMFPDAPSTSRVLVNIPGSMFKLTYVFTFGVYITRIAIEVQPLGHYGRRNTWQVTGESEYSGLP